VVDGVKNRGFATWTGELVLNRLEDAFRRKPEAAIFSISMVRDLPRDGAIEGIHLIRATALALSLESPARIQLLYHARSRSTGESIHKLCENRCWNRSEHYKKVIDASIAVAEWLNGRGISAPALADSSHPPAKRRGPGRPPILGSRPAAGAAALSKSSRMMIEIKKMLSQKESVHRKELLDYLLATAIMGNETDPMQALAIFLSNHKEDFQSDGSGNFSLRKP
jgi:hypothetical protein